MSSSTWSAYAEVPREPRLRALCDIRMADARERAGWHGYDGMCQDLSPAGVRQALARLAPKGPAREDRHDEAQLSAFEKAEQVGLGELELHRRNPRMHIANLDVGVYDRPYAPEPERQRAKRAHLAGWPDAVDAACESLDAVPAPAAAALLSSAKGLAAGAADDPSGTALRALQRFVDHLSRAARESEAPVALGKDRLAALLGAGEHVEVDLAALADSAAKERTRLEGLMGEACARLRPEAPVEAVLRSLVRDHPSVGGVVAEARELTAEAMDFVRARGLFGEVGGECRVVASPPSRRWATASLVWSAPYEPDGPSWFYLTPPDETWSAEEQRQWLQAFSRTTLPSTVVHESSPGHFVHGRMLREASSDVRKTLQSPAFVEGWAHYGEELCVEEGFRAEDPRFVIGVAAKALLRVVRLEVSVGLHSEQMSIPEACAAFERDAFLKGPAALAEARRAVFDPTYGRYTWGKLVLREARQRAREQWGTAFALSDFHHRVLSLGAPALGLVDNALAQNGEPFGGG